MIPIPDDGDDDGYDLTMMVAVAVVMAMVMAKVMVIMIYAIFVLFTCVFSRFQVWYLHPADADCVGVLRYRILPRPLLAPTVSCSFT